MCVYLGVYTVNQNFRVGDTIEKKRGSFGFLGLQPRRQIPEPLKLCSTRLHNGQSL